MSLLSGFELELTQQDDSLLERLRHRIFQQLLKAPKSFRHPWHQGTVASVDGQQARARIVVLQAVEAPDLKLRFHTDRRASKVGQLELAPRIEWLFYQPASRIQLRLTGEAEVLTSGPDWESAWKNTVLQSRRCYLAPLPPATPVPDISVNLPAGMENRHPSAEESEAGRANFAIVNCRIQALDWMFLHHNGHLRCLIENQNGQWQTAWATP